MVWRELRNCGHEICPSVSWFGGTAGPYLYGLPAIARLERRDWRTHNGSALSLFVVCAQLPVRVVHTVTWCSANPQTMEARAESH